MVLVPSGHHLNIFTANEQLVINDEPPTTNFLKIHQHKNDVKPISDPNLSILAEKFENDDNVYKESEGIDEYKGNGGNEHKGGDVDKIGTRGSNGSGNRLGRNRYFSTTCLSSLLRKEDNSATEFRKKRHFSTDSLNTCEEENNNVFIRASQTMPTISSSKSLNNLPIKKTPPQVAPKPLKRRISDLFSMKTHVDNSRPVIVVEETNRDRNLTGHQPETPKQRTPGLFRKFGKSVPSIIEVYNDEKPNKDDNTFLATDTKTHNRGTGIRKSRSFSLKTEDTVNGNTLKLPGPKTFPSFRRSPFSKTKFDHQQQQQHNTDLRKKNYDDMLKCIQENDCKKIKLLLKRRNKTVEVNNLEHNLSLLHEASYKGCSKCTRALIKAGWSINLTDSLGWKPLHAAVFGGSLETVKVLLANGGERVNDITTDGLTPLHLAVHLGDLYIVHELMTHGSNPLLSTTDFPETPFQLSINLKKTLILDYFLFQSCFLVDNQ